VSREISDSKPCAQAQSNILHIKYIEKTVDGLRLSVKVSVLGYVLVGVRKRKINDVKDQWRSETKCRPGSTIKMTRLLHP